MRLAPVSDLLARQDGVVSRAQLIGALSSAAQIDTLLRRRDLVVVHPGVYLDHTGTPTWTQPSWAAVLYAGHSALHLESALQPTTPRNHTGPPGRIHVAIDWSRKVKARPGICIHRVRDLDDSVLWNLSPPRVRIDVAALGIAHRAETDLAAIAALTSVVGSRRTVSARLRTALDERPRIARRALLVSLLDDLERGTHSVLEHGFLDRVVRPHGLPEPSAQQAPRVGVRGAEYRDVEYVDLGLVLELDGATHDTAEARDEDADRDLDDLATGHVVPRLRYRQVFGTPCRTALRLEALLRLRGWRGSGHECGQDSCHLRGRSSSDVRGDVPR